ncbi:MAG: tetratricopeptide repeat protein [Deltaproteobacteria bacterium]|nr:MAG: tetratricopeptide repeat protein [Deltaproteobacteria bacterium]
MKNDTILVGVVALVAGLIIGWMAGQKSSTPAPAPVAAVQGGAPMAAPAPTPNFQQQINELKAVVAGDPNNRQAWVALGNAYFDSDRPMESIEAYQKALDLNARDANVLTDQGVMFRRLGWFDRAIDNFTKANQADPNHATSLYNLGITYRYDLQNFAKAQEAWTKFLAVNPTGPGSDRVRQELEFFKTHPPVSKP